MNTISVLGNHPKYPEVYYYYFLVLSVLSSQLTPGIIENLYCINQLPVVSINSRIHFFWFQKNNKTMLIRQKYNDYVISAHKNFLYDHRKLKVNLFWKVNYVFYIFKFI